MKMTLDHKSLDSLSLDLVKQHLMILDTTDDPLIQAYMAASLTAAEKYMHHPITSESYTSEVSTSYEVPYQPSNVYLYQDSVLIQEVDFTYQFPNLTITPPNDVVFNTVKADIQGINNAAIDQARLLLIGTNFRVRENEDFSNMREIPFGVSRLLDLNSKSFL